MGQAPSQITSQLESLQHPGDDHTCRMCSNSLCGPSAWVGDAAQAFEAVSCAQVSRATEDLLALSARLKQPDAIQVHCTPKVSVTWGGSIFTPFRDRFIYTRRTLSKFVAVALMMRIFVFGPLAIIQREGIPIGGPWSPTLLSVVLCKMEHLMIKFKWRVLCSQFPGLPRDFRKAVCLVRYVDDILIASHIL